MEQGSRPSSSRADLATTGRSRYAVNVSLMGKSP
jgi:hypothetical protein